MKKRILAIVLTSFCISVHLIGPHLVSAQIKTSKKNFKQFKKLRYNNVLAKDILKSPNYREIHRQIISTGRKGVASRNRLKVYYKVIIATNSSKLPRSSVTGNFSVRLRLKAKQQINYSKNTSMKIGGVFVDSGKELGKDPTPVGIIMMGLDNQEYQYSIRGNTLEDSTRFNGISDTNWDLALKLMAKKEKDKPLQPTRQ